MALTLKRKLLGRGGERRKGGGEKTEGSCAVGAAQASDQGYGPERRGATKR